MFHTESRLRCCWMLARMIRQKVSTAMYVGTTSLAWRRLTLHGTVLDSLSHRERENAHTKKWRRGNNNLPRPLRRRRRPHENMLCDNEEKKKKSRLD